MVASFSALHKRVANFARQECEATPIVWNGRLLVVIFDRNGFVVFKDFNTTEQVARIAWDYSFGCAFVDADGSLTVFGTHGTKKHVVCAPVAPDYTLGPIRPVLDAWPDQKIYNLSVCKGPHGYVLAYEADETGLVPFSVRFAVSPDMVAWTHFGTVYEPTVYVACPTIRYVNGAYHVLHLRETGAGGWATYVTRTVDFEKFSAKSAAPVFAADDPSEGVNCSDVDLLEHNGVTHFTYMIGDQKTWWNVRTAVYIGTMAQFFAEAYPA
jgi:hypothetical protein